MISLIATLLVAISGLSLENLGDETLNSPAKGLVTGQELHQETELTQEEATILEIELLARGIVLPKTQDESHTVQ